MKVSSVLPNASIGSAMTNGHSEPYWAVKSTSGVRPLSTANVSSSVKPRW